MAASKRAHRIDVIHRVTMNRWKKRFGTITQFPHRHGNCVCAPPRSSKSWLNERELFEPVDNLCRDRFFFSFCRLKFSISIGRLRWKPLGVCQELSASKGSTQSHQLTFNSELDTEWIQPTLIKAHWTTPNASWPRKNEPQADWEKNRPQESPFNFTSISIRFN